MDSGNFSRGRGTGYPVPHLLQVSVHHVCILSYLGACLHSVCGRALHLRRSSSIQLDTGPFSFRAQRLRPRRPFRPGVCAGADCARSATAHKIVVKRGWLFPIVFSMCMAISALYELFEWRVAVATGSSADAFLGTQGDPWDTQEDMATAGVGAIVALSSFSRWHDRLIRRKDPSC